MINKLKNTRTIYSICFFLLMLIDWTRGSQLGVVWACTVNLTGVVMALIIASAYDVKGYKRPIFYLYTLLCLIGGVILYQWWNAHQEVIWRDKLLSAYMNVWALGIVTIRIWLERNNAKKEECLWKRKSAISKILMLMFGALMLLILFSVNEDLWPILYFFAFGLFYLVDYSEEKLYDLQMGLCNGVIFSFFFLQGLAFVFRPYDTKGMRYAGMYSNSNMTALFYSMVIVAFAVKLHYARKENAPIYLRLFYFLFMAATTGFAIMTICRTAGLALICVAFMYLLGSEWKLLKNGWKTILIRALAFLLVVAVSVPIDYAAARYLPPLFHHPVWYDGEYGESRVFSWDPWDSEKYVSFEEMMSCLLGRWGDFGAYFAEKSRDSETNDIESEEANVQQIGEESEKTGIYVNGKFVESTDKDYKKKISVASRLAIWSHFIPQGNLTGHSNEEGHDMNAGYKVWHMQNMTVQYWYYYGIPAAILFVITLLGCGILTIIGVYEKKDSALLGLLVLTLFGVYGLFEAVWYPGQMILTLALIAPKFVLSIRKQ